MDEELNRPLVSTVIIFLNEERFLTEAIESVLAQSYRHWELLLVDDGSTDGSTAIARRIAEMHPGRIHYLEHPGHENRGMSASRNLGVSHAAGAYIAFLDADDVWVQGKLESQVAVLETNPQAALVHGPLLEWHSWTGDPNARDRPYGVGRTGTHPYAGSTVQPPRLVALFLAYQEFIPSGSLLRRSAMEQVGGFEDNFRGNFEDAVLYVKLGLAFPICVVHECSYWYRLHPNSFSRTTRKAGHSDTTRLRFMEWVAGYLSAHQVTDAATWRALRLATRRARHPWSRMLEPRYLSLQFDAVAKAVARRLLPASVYRWLSSRQHSPAVSLRGRE